MKSKTFVRKVVNWLYWNNTRHKCLSRILFVVSVPFYLLTAYTAVVVIPLVSTLMWLGGGSGVLVPFMEGWVKLLEYHYKIVTE